MQNGVHYTLDLNSGLTQVLSDGANTYLYGLGRISENQGGATEYYLGDALGSVRQLTDSGGEVTLTRHYDPFGTMEQSLGTGQTVYGFSGEITDANGLVYLRTRFYVSGTGRFVTRDTWAGDVVCRGGSGIWLVRWYRSKQTRPYQSRNRPHSK